MIRSARGLAAFVGVTTVLVAVAIPVGRWERAHAVRVQQEKIEAIVKLTPSGIGPRGLAAFRLSDSFDCLLYRVRYNPYAIELCFDAEGRLIEAIDRRNESSLRIGSLRYDPAAAPIQIAPAKLVRYFRGIDLLKGVKLGERLPLGFSDLGPFLYAGHCKHCLASG